MLDSIRRFLPGAVNKLVDRGENLVIRKYLNQHYRSLGPEGGPVKHLDINRSERSMKLEMELAGESGAVALEVAHYEILEQSGKQFFQVEGLQTNRPWMDALFAMQASNGKLLLGRELPTEIVLALK